MDQGVFLGAQGEWETLLSGSVRPLLEDSTRQTWMGVQKERGEPLPS